MKSGIEFILTGDPRTKKNSLRLVNGKALPSKAFAEYQEAVGWQIPCKWAKIGRPLNLKCVYHMKTRRKVDLCNLLSATCDILVHYGVLEDDNSGIVVGHDGSRVLYDKDNPRAEITITYLGGKQSE